MITGGTISSIHYHHHTTDLISLASNKMAALCIRSLFLKSILLAQIILLIQILIVGSVMRQETASSDLRVVQLVLLY